MSTHTMMLGGAFLADTFQTACLCGWEGEHHATEADAIDEWDNHCDVVFMEATMEVAE